MIDTWYGALQDTATRSLPAVPLGFRQDALGLREAAARGGTAYRPVSGPAGGAGSARRSAGSSGRRARGTGRPRTGPSAAWYCRSVTAGCSSRVAAALFGPRIAFIVLLVAASLAFGYVLAGRSLRALAMRVAVMPRYDIARQRDDGPLARLIGQVAGDPVPAAAGGTPGDFRGMAAMVWASGAVTRPPQPIWVVPSARHSPWWPHWVRPRRTPARWTGSSRRRCALWSTPVILVIGEYGKRTAAAGVRAARGTVYLPLRPDWPDREAGQPDPR